MRAQPVEHAPAVPTEAAVAAAPLGGAVAEWQRSIEQRYLAWPLDVGGERRGERVLALASRFAGYAALAAGYALIGFVIFG